MEAIRNQIKERLKDREAAKPIKENQKTENLRREIARFTTAIGVRVLRASGDELVKLNSAIGLLNHAQMMVDTSETEAKKLFSIARNLKSVNEVKDEPKNEKNRRTKRRLNENRKKNSDR